MSDKDTLQLAQKLVNRLPKEMDDELKSLIQRAKDGQDTTVEIIDLLSPHENIRRWMREQINAGGGRKGMTRGYDPLPGRQGSVRASEKWTCPRAGCDETLPVIRDEEDPPTCGLHKAVMVRAETKQG